MESNSKKALTRIALTGPESSGKSFLAEHLASSFRGSNVKEYAREYLEERSPKYTYKDFKNMALGQWQRILDAEKLLKPVFFDTEMIVFQVWSKIKYGRIEDWLKKLVLDQPVDYYLLCYPDLPWEEDELRDYPGQEDRLKLFDEYRQLLESLNYSYSVIKGGKEERVILCEDIVSALVNSNE